MVSLRSNLAEKEKLVVLRALMETFVVSGDAVSILHQMERDGAWRV
jgi:hypothetical protein